MFGWMFVREVYVRFCRLKRGKNFTIHCFVNVFGQLGDVFVYVLSEQIRLTIRFDSVFTPQHQR